MPLVQVGPARLAATGAVDGLAIFHLIPGAQEAVVPLETRNASSYLLAFDNVLATHWRANFWPRAGSIEKVAGILGDSPGTIHRYHAKWTPAGRGAGHTFRMQPKS